MERALTPEQALDLVNQLSPPDQVRLIERMAPDIERALSAARPIPRKSLRGLWRGLDITEEDITVARREMWGSFPLEEL